MTQKQILYDTTTGEIIGVVQVRGQQLWLQEGQALIDGEVDGAAHYVLNGVPTPRPQAEAHEDGQGAFTFSGVPTNTPVTVTNEAGDELVLGGADTLSLTDPGAYRIRCAPPFPFKGFDFEVQR